MTRNKLYSIIGLACASGFLWLAAASFFPHVSGFGICPFKHATGIPCPSCGVTRAVKLLLEGDLWHSLLMNPFGIIVASLMVVLPFWCVIDLIRSRATLLNIYQKSESTLRRPWIASVLAVLVVANWIWGISKGL